ncbi:GntR family transcriptional regulator [Acetobacteraceae bacterium H6797]|nr:GntR family transcriptional regulator [Acetobacteraceae bacterium H6797]
MPLSFAPLPIVQGGNLAETAYGALLEMLLARHLPLDQPLSERGLAAELGVSRTPLREAMRRLEGEGMLERVPGGAMRVRQIPLEEFLEIQQVRRLLEGEAAAMAAGRIALGVLTALDARIEALLFSRADQAEREAERRAIDLALHGAVSEAAGNATLTRLIEEQRRRMMLVTIRRPPERLEEACAQYRAVIQALASGEPEAARRAMVLHVDALRSAVMKRLAAL